MISTEALQYICGHSFSELTPLKLHKNTTQTPQNTTPTPQNTTPTPQNTIYTITVAVCWYNTVKYTAYV